MLLYKTAGKQAVATMRGLPDEAIDGPSLGPVPEPYQPFFGQMDPTLKRMLMHDHYHRGQMNLLAKG